MRRHLAIGVLTLFTLASTAVRAQEPDRGGIEGDPIPLDWVDARSCGLTESSTEPLHPRGA